MTFQRYPRPAGGILTGAPRSWGALPVAAAANGDLVVPVADDEAVWLGLSPRSDRRSVLVVLEAELDDGTVRDAVAGTAWSEAGERSGLVVPPTRWVDGIGRPDGHPLALARVGAGRDAPGTRAVGFRVMPHRVGFRGRPSHPRVPTLHAPAPADPARSVTSMAVAPVDGAVWDVSRCAVARVRLVDPRAFTEETGEAPPAPRDPGASYGGWRLP